MRKEKQNRNNIGYPLNDRKCKNAFFGFFVCLFLGISGILTWKPRETWKCRAHGAPYFCSRFCRTRNSWAIALPPPPPFWLLSSKRFSSACQQAMAKGDDVVRRRRNKTNRKRARNSESVVSARVAAIIAAKHRRKAGKRRICEVPASSV